MPHLPTLFMKPVGVRFLVLLEGWRGGPQIHHGCPRDFPRGRGRREWNACVAWSCGASFGEDWFSEGQGFSEKKLQSAGGFWLESAAMMVKLNWMHKEMEDFFGTPWIRGVQMIHGYILDSILEAWWGLWSLTWPATARVTCIFQLSRRWWELKGLRCDLRV